jgi:hypothetical protein
MLSSSMAATKGRGAKGSGDVKGGGDAKSGGDGGGDTKGGGDAESYSGGVNTRAGLKRTMHSPAQNTRGKKK